MAYCGVIISSENLNGQSVNIIFEPCSGGTIDLGTQTLPFIYTTNYWYGTYNCYSLTYDYNYVFYKYVPLETGPSDRFFAKFKVFLKSRSDKIRKT
jgi:subtilase family serine protease